MEQIPNPSKSAIRSTRRRSRADLHAMREVLRRWQASGQTVKEFCQAEDLARSAFYRWRAIVARADSGFKSEPARAHQAKLSSFVPLSGPSPTTVTPDAVVSWHLPHTFGEVSGTPEALATLLAVILQGRR